MPVLLLVGLSVAAALLAPRLGAYVVSRRVIPVLERRFGREITVGRVRSDLRRVVLEDVRVRGPADCAGEPLLAAERITLPYDFWPLLRGRLALGRVTVQRPKVCLRRGEDGRDNLSDLIRALARRRRGGRVTLSVGEIALRRGSLVAHDEQQRIHMRSPSFQGRLAPGGLSRIALAGVRLKRVGLPPAMARRLEVSFRTRDGRLQGRPRLRLGGGRVALHEHLVLTDIAGEISLEEPGWVRLALQGSYGGVGAPLWKAQGRVGTSGLHDPRRAEATLRLQARRFSLDKLAPVLSLDMVPRPAEASLGVDLQLELSRGRFRFSGQAALDGMTVVHPLLARQPVRDVGFEAEIAGEYMIADDLLRVEKAHVKRRGVSLGVGLEVLRLTEEPRIKLSLSLPRTPCARVLGAMPSGLVPEIQKLRLQGSVSMQLEAEVDFHYLTTSSVYLDAGIDARRCRVAGAPYALSAERLRGPFGHELTEAGERFGFEVGPDNPDFVSIDQVSLYLIKAILTTEDSRFYRHRGFIPQEFQTALARNLIARRFVFGASSITMQVVKNVLLGRHKTLARKLQELVLTWYLERHLSKDRIMEIYLNVIELGPGIFGIGRAAWHLFGKDASDLAPQEAAYLASILPSPKRHYRKYCRQKVGRRWRRLVDRILHIMHRRGRLNDSELALGLASPIQFSEQERGSYGACIARLDRFRQPGTRP